MDGVDGETWEMLDEAAGPADFDGIDFGGGAEAEVDAHVAIGDVARAAAYFVDEDAGAGFYRNAGADGGAGGKVGSRGG